MYRYADLLARLEITRRIGVSLGLKRVQDALEMLGAPHRKFPAVHIAGTNGKGSTAAMTAAILRAAGLRVGLYTSPHLSRFTERIRIDGVEIDGDRLAAFDPSIQATGIPLTYFEVATVLAFLAFADAEVDVAVLETGLGGRLDATNVCHPLATAITSISFDHTEMLGESLREIAGEKAGIAKAGIPLFLGPVPAEADEEIARVAAGAGARLLRLARDFGLGPTGTSGTSSLPGAHQVANATLAVALAREALTGISSEMAARPAPRLIMPVVSDAGIRKALVDVAWPGRLERVPPDVLLDCAHNPEGATALASDLDQRPGVSRALVVSIVEGKSARAMLHELIVSATPGAAPTRFAAIYLTQSSSPRAIPSDALLACVPDVARSLVHIVPTPREAMVAARIQLAAPREIVVAGSIFLVGDVRAELLGEVRDPIQTSDPMGSMARIEPPPKE